MPHRVQPDRCKFCRRRTLRTTGTTVARTRRTSLDGLGKTLSSHICAKTAFPRKRSEKIHFVLAFAFPPTPPGKVRKKRNKTCQSLSAHKACDRVCRHRFRKVPAYTLKDDRSREYSISGHREPESRQETHPHYFWQYCALNFLHPPPALRPS